VGGIAGASRSFTQENRMPFWIFHRGWGLIGIPVAAAGPVTAFFVPIFARVLEPFMPIVLGVGVLASALALIALDRRLGRRLVTEVVDPGSGVCQRVVGARDSVMFVPLAGWGWLGLVLAGLLFLVGA
jgi:hypothetical protein